MRTLCIALPFVLLSGAAAQQPWKLALDVKGNLSYLSENWADRDAAGKLSWSLATDAGAEKQIGPRLNSRTVLKLAFGQTKEYGMAPEKTTDLIDLESVLKATLGGWVDPFISVRGESRFADMSHPHTRYLNPTTVTEVIGAMRVLLKNDDLVWDVRLGAAAKQQIDRWAPDNDWETRSSNNGGIELVTEFNTRLLKDQVVLKSTLRIYEAIFSDKADVAPNYWRYPDINWQTLLSTSIAKNLMVGYTVEFEYDRETDANIQHRHLLSLGVTLSGPRPKAPPVDTPAPEPAASEPSEE